MTQGVEPITSRDAFVFTPSDSTVAYFDALYIGGTGNVTLITAKGNSALFSNLPAGIVLPQAGSKVMATGTTATLITAMKY